MLAARAGGAVNLHLHILGPDINGPVVLDLRHDLHRGKGGLAAGVCVKGRDANQTVDAVLTLQKAIGILALDGDGGGFEASLVPVLIVQGLVLEFMALRPAGIHPIEHGGPVLSLGAARAGMEGDDGVISIVLAGQQGGQPGFLHLLLQLGAAALQLGKQIRVVRLLAHFAQGGHILPLADESVLPVHPVLQLLEPLVHHLRALQIVPEAVLAGLLLQRLNLSLRPRHIQGGRQLFQLGTQVLQPLLIFIVFDQSHGIFSTFL